MKTSIDGDLKMPTDNVFFASGSNTRRPIELDDTHLSGWRASDLAQTTAIYDNTLFAVHRSLSANNISYIDLSSDVKDQALKLMRVGSMAYAEPWEYSLTSHSHAGEYSDTSANVLYGSGQGMFIARLSVGETSVESPTRSQTTVISVYCPIVKPQMQEPAYGTLRFMYAASAIVDNSYIASENFDGWIYPDGREFTVDPDQFTFGKNDLISNTGPNPFLRGNKLTVPNLNSFLKPNPFIEYTASGSTRTCKYDGNRSYHTAVPPHSHVIQNLKMRLQLGIDIGKSSLYLADQYNTPNKNTTHQGGNDKKHAVTWQKVTAKITVKNGGMSFGLKESGADAEVKPTHDTIAVMIYVGGRRQEYDKVYLT